MCYFFQVLCHYFVNVKVLYVRLCRNPFICVFNTYFHVSLHYGDRFSIKKDQQNNQSWKEEERKEKRMKATREPFDNMRLPMNVFVWEEADVLLTPFHPSRSEHLWRPMVPQVDFSWSFFWPWQAGQWGLTPLLSMGSRINCRDFMKMELAVNVFFFLNFTTLWQHYFCLLSVSLCLFARSSIMFHYFCWEGFYWAAFRNPNEFSDSCHCLLNFCYISGNYKNGWDS